MRKDFLIKVVNSFQLQKSFLKNLEIWIYKINTGLLILTNMGRNLYLSIGV